MLASSPLLRLRVAGATLLRGSPWLSVGQASALLAAALIGAAFGAGAWAVAGVGAGALVATGLTALQLRVRQRALGEARRARAEWERRYYRLHDSIAVGVFRADRHGRLTAANRGLCALLGYRSESEVVSLDFAEQSYVGPGTFLAVLARARAQGALENLEVRLRRFDGLTVTALATVQAIWDEAGDVTVFEGTLIDLTRERLAESQRRSMERRYRHLFDASTVAMLVGNLRRGTLEEANPALVELFGLRPSELPVPLEQVIPAEQRRMHRGVRAALETHGVAGPLAVEYVRAGGERIPVTLSAAMVDPQHGEFVAVLADRAAEARALRAAGQLQAFHEALLEDAPTPVAVFDGARGLVRGNAALGTLLGTPALSGDAVMAGLVGSAAPAAAAIAVTRAMAGEIARFEADVESGSNRLRLAITLVPRCGDGVESTGFLAFVTDTSVGGGLKTGTSAVTAAASPPPSVCVAGRRSA